VFEYSGGGGGGDIIYPDLSPIERGYAGSYN
jgi:hypothetical protein